MKIQHATGAQRSLSTLVSSAFLGTLLALGGASAVLASVSPDTVQTSSAREKNRAVRPYVPAASTPLAPGPVVTVETSAPGQAGYVHFFVITWPDGELETQVALELPGDRVAWSFPEGGVAIAPFVKSGQIVANGKVFEIEHLYGVRPFADDAAMAALRRDLDARVAWWVDQKTAYCDEQDPSNRLCVSCLGFVLRVLYPGTSPTWPALPADFKSARRNIYTTEDLLMYLARVPLDGTRQSRMKRIQALQVPDSLREELARISNDVLPEPTVAKTGGARPAIAKPRSVGRSVAAPARRVVPRTGS